MSQLPAGSAIQRFKENESRVDDFVNGSGYMTSNGVHVDGLPGKVDQLIYNILSFNNRGAWVTATAYAVKDLVSVSGTYYVAVVAHTSGATFGGDASKWRVFQGVIAGDLAATTGSQGIGIEQNDPFAVAETLFAQGIQIVTPENFGAGGVGMTDDGPAIEKAVTYALTFDPPANVQLNGKYWVPNGFNIDRLVDSTAANTMFRFTSRGKGGCLILKDPGTMVKTSLTYTGSPVSQMVIFSNIAFIAEDASEACYVLDSNKFLRIHFADCSFNKIKLLNSTAYVQDITFSGCNGRNWQGTWFKCTGGAYAIRFAACCKFEHGDSFLELTSSDGAKGVAGCSLSDVQIEGMSGFGIKADNLRAWGLSRVYFEGIVGQEITYNTANNLSGLCPNLGVEHGPVYFAQTAAHIADSSYTSILWGNTSGGTSHNCWSNGKLHGLHSLTRISINEDYDTSGNWLGYHTTGNQEIASKSFRVKTGNVALPNAGEGLIAATAVDGMVYIAKGTGADHTWLSQTGNPAMTLGPNTGNLAVAGTITVGNPVLLKSSTALQNGAAAGAGTLTNAPHAGNPDRYFVVNDNGTLRGIPAWNI